MLCQCDFQNVVQKHSFRIFLNEAPFFYQALLWSRFHRSKIKLPTFCSYSNSQYETSYRSLRTKMMWIMMGAIRTATARVMVVSNRRVVLSKTWAKKRLKLKLFKVATAILHQRAHPSLLPTMRMKMVWSLMIIVYDQRFLMFNLKNNFNDFVFVFFLWYAGFHAQGNVLTSTK